MDLLIVEPLDPEVLEWLDTRHSLRYAPELAHHPLALRRALSTVKALVIPPSVALDAVTLEAAPALRAVGRLSAGAENIDLDACARAGVELIRPTDASASAEAEFVIGALLQMLRRVPVRNPEGLMVGRELGSATVGIVGMTTGARPLAQLLACFGSRVVGYDPALHASDPLWKRWGVEPVGLHELFEHCEAVAVLMASFSRYQGLLGDRYLAHCRPHQVLVSLSPSSLFDEVALADVLDEGRMAAAWFDCMEPGMLEPGRPLAEVSNLQTTPRVAATTRESRQRAAWDVARRIDLLLAPRPVPGGGYASAPGFSPDDLVDLEAGPAPA